MTHVQSQSQEVGSGDEGLGLLCFDLSSAETDFWWLEDEQLIETSPIFVFRMTFYVHRGSGQARVYPRRWSSLSSRAKAFTLQGKYRRFVGDFAFHTSLRGAPLLVGEQQEWYHQILQKVQNLMPHDYIPPYTVYTVVQQYLYVLVDYCCFHLTSGASTAVGPYIVHRNRKRFLLSQSTLREEFVEKKYQVLDNRPSNDSSPSEPLFPGGASLKVVEFWSQ